MGRLIVLHRKNICVVCGRVISFSQNSITIENQVLNTKTQKLKTIQCTLLTENGVAERLRLKSGASLIATVKSTPALSQLASGNNHITTKIEVNAYTVRYTGSFDFKQTTEETEQHVFCGQITEKIKLEKGGNLIVVSWLKCGTPVKKTLYSKVDISSQCPKKGIFITGKERETSFGPMYSLKAIATI